MPEAVAAAIYAASEISAACILNVLPWHSPSLDRPAACGLEVAEDTLISPQSSPETDQR